MKAKTWLLFIGLNIIVSALTTLGVLYFTSDSEESATVTVMPRATSVAKAPTTPEPTDIAETLPTTGPTVSPSVEHIVRDGDTLGGIALEYEVSLPNLLLANGLTEDDIINPGQRLVIPFGVVATPTAVTPSAVPATPTPSTPTAYPTETPTPPGPVQVRIQEVLAPGDLWREGVVVINRGRTVNLFGWSLGSENGEQVYVFPRITLGQEIPVTVYTIAGDDTPQALHWGQGEAQWAEPGKTIELRDAEGDLIATYAIP